CDLCPSLAPLTRLSCRFLLFLLPSAFLFFVFNDPAPTEIYTLSLHDALPIWPDARRGVERSGRSRVRVRLQRSLAGFGTGLEPGDRKSTRLNSSHVKISYAVFCLKKKKKIKNKKKIKTERWTTKQKVHKSIDK